MSANICRSFRHSSRILLWLSQHYFSASRYAKGEIDELSEDTVVPNAGALSVNDAAVVQVDFCDFRGHGGKMGTIHTTHEAWLLLDDSKFEDNFGGNGGGVFIEGEKSHSVKITDVNFTSNAARAGGGLVILGKGSVALKNTFFEANKALLGGGIYSDFALPEQEEYETCGKASEGTRITIERTRCSTCNILKEYIPSRLLQGH